MLSDSHSTNIIQNLHENEGRLSILGADDTGLCGQFGRGFLAHDMGFMYRFCYVFFTHDMGVMRRPNGQVFFHFLTDDMGISDPSYT